MLMKYSCDRRPTIVYGIYKPRIYDEIKPIKISLNETVTTPAECPALVHRDHCHCRGV